MYFPPYLFRSQIITVKTDFLYFKIPVQKLSKTNRHVIVPAPFEVSSQLNVAHMLQLPQSSGAFHFQHSSCQALDQLNLQTLHYQVHGSAMVGPEESRYLVETIVKSLKEWERETEVCKLGEDPLNEKA